MTNESLYERARELLNGIMKEERDAYPITDKDYFCSDIQEIIDIAGENNYQVYRSNCDDPQVVLIGNKKEKHSAASALFINDLAGKKFFERYKLLAEGYTGKVVYENMNTILAMDGVTPHIYGKKETRPFRKMGHVTIVHKDMSTARTIAQKVKETIKVISN